MCYSPPPSSGAGDLAPTVILDTPGQGDDQMEDDDDQFIVEDSAPLVQPLTEAFAKVDDDVMDEKPEGTLIIIEQDIARVWF